MRTVRRGLPAYPCCSKRDCLQHLPNKPWLVGSYHNLEISSDPRTKCKINNYRILKVNVNGHNLMHFTLCTVEPPLGGHSNKRSSPFYSPKSILFPIISINGIHFRTDLFYSKSQSDMLTLITIKFDESRFVDSSRLLAEYNYTGSCSQ